MVKLAVPANFSFDNSLRLLANTMSRAPSSKSRDLAERLVTREATIVSDDATETHTGTIFSLSEKLRRHLSRLVGPSGFRALLVRALALATRELPSLRDVEIKTDGTLDGFSAPTAEMTSEAYTIVLAHLLDLLVSFIGEPLTLQVLRDVWPDVLSEDNGANPKEHDEPR